MWFLLNFIPESILSWLIHIVVAIGFVLQFAGLVRSVPGIAPYAIVAKQLGIENSPLINQRVQITKMFYKLVGFQESENE